jgi:hypothetical protein
MQRMSWTTDTIFGIILLGSIGSVIATGALWIAKWMVTKWIPAYFRWCYRFGWRRGYVDGFDESNLLAEGDNAKIAVFFIYRVSRLLVALSTALILFFTLYAVHLSPDSPLWLRICVSIVGWLCIFFVIGEFLAIRRVFRGLFAPLFERAIASAHASERDITIEHGRPNSPASGAST